MKIFSKDNVRFVFKTDLLIGNEIAQTLPKHLGDNFWNNIAVVVDKGDYENNNYVIIYFSLI